MVSFIHSLSKKNNSQLSFRYFGSLDSSLTSSNNKYLVSDFFIKSKSHLKSDLLFSDSIAKLKMSLLIFSKIYIKKYSLNLYLKNLLKKKDVVFQNLQHSERLITVQHNLISSNLKTYSVWYSHKNYQKFIFEDFFIRKYLNSIFLKSQKFKKIGGSIYILRTHGKLFIKFFYFSPIFLNKKFYSRLEKIGLNFDKLNKNLLS